MSFSKKSHDLLYTCDAPLIRLFESVDAHGYECTILEGNRSEERQEELIRTGQSKTTVEKAKHCTFPSQAVDVSPYPVDWNNHLRFYAFASYVRGVAAEMMIPIRWGGDWDSDFVLDDQTFMDLVHFELIGG